MERIVNKGVEVVFQPTPIGKINLSNGLIASEIVRGAETAEYFYIKIDPANGTAGLLTIVNKYDEEVIFPFDLGWNPEPVKEVKTTGNTATEVYYGI